MNEYKAPGNMSMNKAKSTLRKLGPGLITGASRNDPSSVATYAKIGAQMGYAIIWTSLYLYPLLAGIQDISARVGRVTGRGIAGNARLYYPRWVLYGIVLLLVIANTITLGADIGAMGEALRMLIGGSALLYSALFALASLILQICISYEKYVAMLKWLTLALLAYVATAFVVRIAWDDAIFGTLIPSISFNTRTMAAVVAAFGATINPYLFFWQASQEVEEQETTPGDVPLRQALPEQVEWEIRRIKLDTYLGMAFSNAIAFFIILTAAATLHSRGVTDIRSAANAAEALRPVAGQFAFLLFSAGIIGTGFLALPVLAGSAAYAVGEAMDWPVSLQCKPLEAKGFYSILTIAALLGVAMNFTHIDTIRALYIAAVINGIIAVPIMVVLMLMSANPNVMGRRTLSSRLRIMGWLTTVIMAAAAVGLLVTSI